MEQALLKEFLSENRKSKTKSELVNTIQGLHKLLGPDVYNSVTGYQLSELDSLSAKNLRAVVKLFGNSYAPEWEALLQGAPEEISAMLGLAAAMKSMQENDMKAQDDSDAAKADFVAELGNLDFANMLSAPLSACVEAQNNASMATVSFIKEVGFDDDDNLRMVDFTHKRTIRNPNFGKDPADVPAGTNVSDEFLENQEIKLEVPFISLLNVPSMRVENCEIDFNVKLNSVYTRDVSSEFKLDASLGIDYKWVKFDVSASYQRSMSTGVKIEKEYNLGVKVVATNDQLPGQLENVLGILAG